LGVEGIFHFLAEVVVGGGVFGGEEGGGAEAVLEGVLGGAEFSVVGFWAGGLEGVLTVGEQLFFGAHFSPFCGSPA